MPGEVTNQGRAIFVMPQLSAYMAPDGSWIREPHARELILDDRDDKGHYVIPFKDIDGNIVLRSATHMVDSILEDLKLSGVQDNAGAFVNNRGIKRIIADNGVGVLRLNPDLVFHESIRYYTVEELGYDNDGNIIHISGLINPDTQEPQTYLCEMEQINNPNGNGLVSVALEGRILPNRTMESEKYYRVRYYNDKLIEVMSPDSYSVYIGTAASLALTPSEVISGIDFSSNRKTSEQEIYFYQGESTDVISMEIFLKYLADPRTHNITHLLGGGNQLEMTDLSTIDTSTVTQIGDEKQIVTIKYQIPLSNMTLAADDPNNIIVNGSRYVKRDIPVNIVEDRNGTIYKLVPIVWIYDNMGVKELRHMVFAILDNGAFMNLSSRVETFNLPNVVVPRMENISLSVRYGSDLSLFTNPKDCYLAQLDNNEIQFSYNPTIASDTITRTLDYNAEDLTMRLIIKDNGDINQLKADNSYYDSETQTDLQPTHFRIRNVEGTHYFLGGNGLKIDNAEGFNYQMGQVAVRDMDDYVKPLIIEFLYVQMVDGIDRVIRVLNARPYYPHATNETLL